MELQVSEIIARGYIKKEESELLDSNLIRKINLIDDDGDGESIWVNLLNSEGTNIYDGKSHGDHIYGVLLNNAVVFLPNQSWGVVIKIITQGENRSISYAKLPDNYNDYVEHYKDKSINV